MEGLNNLGNIGGLNNPANMGGMNNFNNNNNDNDGWGSYFKTNQANNGPNMENKFLSNPDSFNNHNPHNKFN